MRPPVARTGRHDDLGACRDCVRGRARTPAGVVIGVQGAMSSRVDTLASTASSLPWRRALAWLAFLGPFFFLSYGLANWAAGQRADVPSVVFDWEAHIPFW